MGGKSVKMLSFLDNEVDRKQVNAAFKKYDADGSGMLNRDEFKKFCGDLVEFVIHKYPETKCVEVVEDAISNTELTLKAMNPETKTRIIRILSETLFEELDTDGSGSISVSEWEKAPWSTMISLLSLRVRGRKSQISNTLVQNDKYHVVLGYGETPDVWSGTIEFETAKTITGKIGVNTVRCPPSRITSGGISIVSNVDPDTFPVGAYFKALLDIVDGINPNKMKVEGLASFCLGASMLSGTVVVTGYLTKA